MIKFLGNRIIISFSNFKLNLKNFFYFSHPEKNKIIPLGTNCYVRFKPTQYGIKPKKKQGELSFPFDLSHTPVESVARILDNDFEDFFDDIFYDDVQKIWINKKYNIRFIHDKINDKNWFIDRYNRRIKNLHDTLSHGNCLYSTMVINLKDSDTINTIYDYLKTKSGNNNFIYTVFNFKYNKDLTNSAVSIDSSSINQNIKYFKLDADERYCQRWWTADTEYNENYFELTKFFIDTICGELKNLH